MRFVYLLLWGLSLTVTPALAQEPERVGQLLVRVLTDSFVLPEKFRGLQPIARDADIRLEHINVDAAASSAREWLDGADLVILDVPRPNDRARVEQALESELEKSGLPSITIGGGRPAWRGLAARDASRLLGYYAAGGEQNFRQFFDAVRIWKEGGDLSGLSAAERLPATGYYHPDAPGVFDSLDDYLAWGASRWKDKAGRIGFITHSNSVSGMQTGLLDALVARTEAEELVPVVFWFDASDPESLTGIARPGGFDALVNLTHMQNGKARSAEFLGLDIPVIQTVGFRDGGRKEWAKAASGIPARTAAIFLAGTEGWGMIDPLVLTAVEDGARVVLPEQLDALVGKLAKLVALRRKPAAEKHLALLFWNHPVGEKNLGASNLNVPTSIETISAQLAQAGYDVEPPSESEMIEAGQAMLGASTGPCLLKTC